MTEVTCTALRWPVVFSQARFCFCWQSWARGRQPQPCFCTVLSQDTHCSVPSRLPHLPLSPSLCSFLSPVPLFTLTHSTIDSPFCTHSSGSAQLSQELSCQASEWPVKATARVKVSEPFTHGPGARRRSSPVCFSVDPRRHGVSRGAPSKGSGSFVESGQEEGWSRKVLGTSPHGEKFPQGPLPPRPEGGGLQRHLRKVAGEHTQAAQGTDWGLRPGLQLLPCLHCAGCHQLWCARDSSPGGL